MNQQDLELLLIKCLHATEANSGRAQSKVSSRTNPLVDMFDFDSLNCVEVTVDVLETLEIEVKFNNVFMEEQKTLTIAEAATRLLKCMDERR